MYFVTLYFELAFKMDYFKEKIKHKQMKSLKVLIWITKNYNKALISCFTLDKKKDTSLITYNLYFYIKYKKLYLAIIAIFLYLLLNFNIEIFLLFSEYFKVSSLQVKF